MPIQDGAFTQTLPVLVSTSDVASALGAVSALASASGTASDSGTAP